jgi:hypothetical protein
MRILLAYKYYPSDPTLHVLIRWLPRLVRDVSSFVFSESERGRFEVSEPNQRLLCALACFEPTHVLVWNNLLNMAEVDWCRARGIRVVGLLNSFASFHCGHIPSQPTYFDLLRAIDYYFVPNAPDVPVLRHHGVNAFEMPFFYDPEYYRPLPSWQRLFDFRPIPILFIGAVGEEAAAYRREIIARIASCHSVHVITGQDPQLRNVTRHRPQFRPAVLNWWINRSCLVLNIENVGHMYAPEVINQQIKDRFVDYTSSLVFHGNHLFPAMGAGVACVSEWSAELERFLEPGQDVIVWRDAQEAIERISYFLSHPEERQVIAHSAHDKVLHLHTASVRLRQILDLVAGILPTGCSQ